MIIQWSEAGEYHLERQKPNEDSITILESEKKVVIALCDGVSSCKQAGTGALIASKSVSSLFFDTSEKLMMYDFDSIKRIVVNHLIYDLKEQAALLDENIEELSSTAACVALDTKAKKILCFNIGDSLIGGINNEKIQVLLRPQSSQRGCYTTTTQKVEKVAEVSILDASEYSACFICSDGMWRRFYNDGVWDDAFATCIIRKDYGQMINMASQTKTFDDKSIVVFDVGEKLAA